MKHVLSVLIMSATLVLPCGVLAFDPEFNPYQDRSSYDSYSCQQAYESNRQAMEHNRQVEESYRRSQEEYNHKPAWESGSTWVQRPDGRTSQCVKGYDNPNVVTCY